MIDDALTVALVLDRFDPERGGLEGWTAALAGWLQRAGHGVHIVAFDSVEPRPPGIVVHLLPPAAGRLERAAAVAAFLASRSFDIVHDTGLGWHYDLLHPQGGSREADWLQNQRSRRTVRRLAERWHPARRRRMTELRRLEHRQYREAAGIVVAVSRQVAADLAALEGVAPERLRLIPNGIGSASFARDPARGADMRRRLEIGDATLFVQAAHNFRLKGVATTLRAVARLRQPASAVRLVVLGRDPDPACRRLAGSLGISGQVAFTGFVEDVRPYLWAADACLHPAFYDPCSLAALEALAAGLPLVTTRRNGGERADDRRPRGLRHRRCARRCRARRRDAAPDRARAARGDGRRRRAARRRLGLRAQLPRRAGALPGDHGGAPGRPCGAAPRLTASRIPSSTGNQWSTE
jgi:UDP-glucose:(heptosyl)LPS alpha-1,3-glucosyltransferase